MEVFAKHSQVVWNKSILMLGIFSMNGKLYWT